LQDFLSVPFSAVSQARLAQRQRLAELRSEPESLDPAEKATYDPGASIITY